MTGYVGGFAFTRDKKGVLLLQKTRPEWAKGKWSCIGGHIEPGELPLAAMEREFHEEAGIAMGWLVWHQFLVLESQSRRIHFFRAFGDAVYHARTMTDEKVSLYGLEMLAKAEVVPDVRWMVPLALDKTTAAKVLTVTDEEGRWQ